MIGYSCVECCVRRPADSSHSSGQRFMVSRCTNREMTDVYTSYGHIYEHILNTYTICRLETLINFYSYSDLGSQKSEIRNQENFCKICEHHFLIYIKHELGSLKKRHGSLLYCVKIDHRPLKLSIFDIK